MKKILIVVDYQHDFASPDGALSVPNANVLATNIQSKIDSSDYEARVYTFDTHTQKDYSISDESKLFPIHCEFGTKGWNLFNIKPLYEQWNELIESRTKPFEMFSSANEYFFTKDVFDIWEGNKMFPKWFEITFPKDEYEIEICGLATNYCVKMNIMGLIERGYKVNLIQDCVEGIKNFPDGSIDASFEEGNKIMAQAGVKFK